MPDYVDSAGAARILGLAGPHIVRQYRWRRIFPEPELWIGGSPAWRPATLRAWQAARRRAPARMAR